jgi:signal transduction histidine kinase
LIENGDAVVEGDFLKLHRVLANLLDNAVRHSPEGGTITVDVGGDGTEAFLSVTDEGTGVPVEDRERVFQRFVSLADAPSSAGKKQGPGIGLYVVKGLVEAHGGSVSVKGGGEDRAGACFVVRLPSRRASDQ